MLEFPQFAHPVVKFFLSARRSLLANFETAQGGMNAGFHRTLVHSRV